MGEMKFDAADEQLRFYLFENPSCIYGRLAAAAICLHHNQIPAAIEQLNSVYMRQPNNTMALYALGYCYERLGRESQAVEFYQDCLKFKNYLQLPAQRLAAIYFKNGQLEKTIQQYELLKDQYPDDIATLVILGHLYITTSQYQKAIDTFNTAILIHPDNFQTQNDDIDRLIAQGQLYQALEQLDNLPPSLSESPDLLLKKADILNMLGDTPDAIAQYEQALRICPDILEAAVKLGTLYLQTGAGQLAAQQLNYAIEINDKIVDAYIGLATAQKLAGCTNDALVTLSLAAAIQPNSSLLFAETAKLQFKATLTDFGELSRAENELFAVIAAHQRQISCQLHNPDLHYRLGILMMSIANLKQAIQFFQNALEINPTYHRAKSNLSICLYETNQKQLALKYLTAPDCFDKDTLELYYKTVLLYCDRVKFASSIMNLDRFLKRNFTDTHAAPNISIVLQNLGLLDRAAFTWENLSETANQAINEIG